MVSEDPQKNIAKKYHILMVSLLLSINFFLVTRHHKVKKHEKINRRKLIVCFFFLIENSYLYCFKVNKIQDNEKNLN